jgi:hypothetical protein
VLSTPTQTLTTEESRLQTSCDLIQDHTKTPERGSFFVKN